MFSWSKDSGKRQSSSTYPGRRLSRNNGVTHTPIEGSIRAPGQHTRAQHLKSFLEDGTLKRSTRRVSSDDTTYDTVFQTTRGETLILRVNLPLASSFSNGCPAMTLAGVRARHPWVDSSRMRIIGYDPIQSEDTWQSSGILLGKAVHAVVQHLQLNPPQILEITDPGLAAIQPNATTTKAGTSSRTNGAATPPRNGNRRGSHAGSNDAPPSYHAMQAQNLKLPPPPDVPLPPIPRKFDTVLDDLPQEELDSLLEDELDFLALVHKLPIHDDLQRIMQSKLQDNAAVAEECLQHEDTLKETHASVKELQGKLKDKVAKFQTLEKEQDALCAPPDIKETLRALNKAQRQAFDASEKYAEEWVEDGAKDVDNFVKEFVAQRKVHHLRAAKMELLQNNRLRQSV